MSNTDNKEVKTEKTAKRARLDRERVSAQPEPAETLTSVKFDAPTEEVGIKVEAKPGKAKTKTKPEKVRGKSLFKFSKAVGSEDAGITAAITSETERSAAESRAETPDLHVEGQKVDGGNAIESTSAIDILDYKAANKTRKNKKSVKDRVPPALAERYDPSADEGLQLEQVQARVDDGLTNEASRVSGRTYLRIISSNLFTYLNGIVLVIFIALALVADWKNNDWSKFLFAIIALANTGIGIILEIRSKMTVDKLKIITSPTAMVVRGGHTKAVPVRDVVLDDIIHLEMGKQVCADAIVVKGECEVNESMLTGESVPMHKRVGDMIYSGSFVTSGACRARVDRIGDDNYVETLASYAKKYKKPKSELNNAINLIIKLVSIVMIPLAIILIIRTATSLSHETVMGGMLKYDSDHIWGSGKDYLVYNVITYSSGAIIGMVPTGMFLLTSIALALSVLRLAKRHTLVQNIYCIEMLARVDVLCLDKTGTITDGSMSVKNVIRLRGESNESISEIVSSILSATGDNNQTAIALGDYFGYGQKYVPKVVVPFSSARKLSAVTFEEVGTYFLGAPEYVFGEMSAKLQRLVDDNASQGYRVMALAHSTAEIHGDKLPASRRALGIIIIEDRIRENIVETIKWFKENDVAVKVISGDNPITVSEVARRVGVKDAEKYISLEGLSAREVVEAANRYTVFGRVTPEQKSILVRSMKTKGHTVAMTGDGVNDILAMRQADCAVSMASGAEAARNVAHLVLMDNNFTSMPDVVVEGRRVINNIAMSSSLYLTKTIMTVILTIVCLITGQPYFFATNMTLMYEIFITAIPSLFLALQVNKERVQGRFMSAMLKNSIPGGVTTSLAIIGAFIFWLTARGGAIGSSSENFNAIVVLTLTFTGFSILLRLCQPFNAYRILLAAGTFGLCILAAGILPSVFGIDYATAQLELVDWLFITTVSLAAYCIVQVVHAIIKAVNITPQKVEVEEAAEKKAQLEEQRLLEALRKEKLYAGEFKKEETLTDLSVDFPTDENNQ